MSFTKKLIIALIAALFLIGIGSKFYFANPEEEISEEIEIDSNGTLYLKNIDNIDIQISTRSRGNTISFNMSGPRRDLKQITLSRLNNKVSELRVPENKLNITGTIVVPKDIIVDIRLYDEKRLNIQDQNGDRTSGNFNAFSFESNSVNNLKIDESGINVEGPNNVIISKNYVETYHSSSNTSSDNSSSNNNNDENNNEVENTDSNDSSNEDSSSNNICEIGTQKENDNCCKINNNNSEELLCIGNWKFNTIINKCSYECLSGSELEDYFGVGTRGGLVKEISKVCIAKSTKIYRSDCCNENLKNELYMGPRKGFPDCLGKWYFEEEKDVGCQFKCADAMESREILKEIQNKNIFL